MDDLRFFNFQPSQANPVLLLSADDLGKVLTPKVCLDALEEAYTALAEDPESEPKTLGFKADEGSFHIKAGVYPGTRHIFAAKLNANFPGNPGKGLPTIQGLVVLVDGARGVPLAVMDSGELTALRTAAANAMAARYGARANSRVATIIGAGMQSGYVLEAFASVLPLNKIFVFDKDPEKAIAFCKKFDNQTLVDVKPCKHISDGTRASDVIITCTTAKSPVLLKQHVKPGTFIAALGADSAAKQEVDPELFRDAGVLVDDLEKCALEAELHHALDAGVITKADVRADLCALASGKSPGRENDEEIVLFDSLGTGLQDVAAAAAAYQASKV